MKKITDMLIEMSESEYRDFHSRLMPTVEKSRVLGVRVPKLRHFSGEIYGTEEANRFKEELPHTYYEENNLHAFLIERIPDFECCVGEVDRFLPFVDNWATCDMLRPKVFAKNRERLLPYIRRWLASEHTYTVRYGIGMLMVYFSEDKFSPEWVSEISNEDYYVMMMKAWYFATLLTVRYDAALPYIEEHRLDTVTHNAAIRKSAESRRIDGERKKHLKSLKL